MLLNTAIYPVNSIIFKYIQFLFPESSLWRGSCIVIYNCRREGKLTLKISMIETDQKMTLKFEGRIAGLWVSEVDRTWRTLQPTLGRKKLLLDLTAVTFLDPNGKEILSEIYAKTGAEFLTSSPLTKYF